MHANGKQCGFTLTEIAIVLVIVGLLLGGLMIPISTQVDIRYRSDTEKSLADAREALIGFAVVNGRLPCPADRAANVGMEAVTAAGGPCACTAAGSGIAASGAIACNDTGPSGVSGVLPWATLGLPETDAWGNRFTYRVTARFGRVASGQTVFGCASDPTDPPDQAAFALCSTGDITVEATSGGVTVASGIPAIVISHGKSSLGAWNSQGAQIAGAAGDELENADSDTSFVSSTNIDDQLIWVSPNLLMNRMIAAGKLP